MTKKEKTSKVDEGYPEGEFNGSSSSEPLTAEEISKKYTVPELKYILRENGQKVSGKKQDLVERVLPILNGDSIETSSEDVSNDSESTEEAKTFKVKKVVLAETEDLPSEVNEEPLTSALSTFGIKYEDLSIEDETNMGETTNLKILGFIQNGLIISDFTMSLSDASDSSNVDLKMNIPEVTYSNFEDTVFTFKNLDLSILPSSDPKTLEFSAIMDSLEIMTESNYINLKGLNLLFKSFPDEKGVLLDINIDSFIDPDFNNASINFENLSLNLSIGLDGQSLGVSVNLPTLTLLNKDYRVNLSDLDLNISLPDLKLSSLDLSILLPDFHYTNFDEVILDMDNVDVSHEPILNSNSVNVIIRMDGMDAIGLNSFDELFPMLKITSVNFKNPTTDSETVIKLIGLMSLLDFTKMDLSNIAALLSSGFDLDTYMSNMPDYDNDSLEVNAVDISDEEVSDSDDSGFDLGGVFENCDYSGLGAIRLDLTGLIDSTEIDLSEFGIDASGYDLSDISLPELIGVLTNSEFIMTAITAISKVFSIDFDNLDTSSLEVSFDAENFDPSGLLESLNLSGSDLAGIIEMFTNSDLDLGSIFENCDLSCLGAIELNLTGLIESLGINLSDLGIDLSDYDLSAISLAELIGIISNLDIDMNTITAMLKLFDLELDDLDLDGLINSFDAENFDLSSLLESLNLSGSDLAGIIEMFTNSDLDLGSIFENCDLSCLGAIELNLTGLILSLGINLADLGIDLSDYDLSAISLAELIGILSNLDIDMNTITAMLKLSDLELDDLDFDGLVTSFDEDNFDMNSLLESLNLSGSDIEGITDMFTNSDVDFASVFENCDYSSLDGMVLDLTGLIDSTEIDVSDLGVDLSDYDLSAISLPELITVLSDPELDMAAITSKLYSLDNIDLDGLIANFDAENFDMASLLESLNISDLDISGIADMFSNSDVDFGSIFENCDLSCLGTIELNLTGLIISLGIDLSDLGIDLSNYDLSAISLAELIGILSNLDIDMNTITAVLKLFGLELDDLDLDGLISSFDAENFDLSSLLESLNLSDLDISGIMDMFTNSDVDFASIFENCDLSCLGAIELNLTGLIESVGMDLADFGIDVSDYDLSAISLAKLIGILSNLDFDMNTIAIMLKLFGLELDDLDLNGLISSFDEENFDMTSLLESLNLSDLDITGIVDMFSNSDVDFASVFENCDYSCLGAIELNLTGLIESLDIDLADFGIDVSNYDLSAISLSDVIDILCSSEFIMTAIAVIPKLFGIDLDELDFDGLVTSFDAENFDISGLLASLNLSEMDIPGIFDNFDMNGFDLSSFLNSSISMFIAENFPEATNAYDTELICQTDSFSLESLNKLFDMSFTNGDLKVCIDDELLFEGETTDDLTQEIFEIIDKYLGENEITVKFTDSQGNSNNYAEKIIVE